MEDLKTSAEFEERLCEVRARIEAACARSGRSSDEVRLLPVTKGVSPELINIAAAAGLTEFGESKVQEARQKISLCSDRLRWHMIGHLQSNKVRDVVGFFEMIHSVDSLKLLNMINGAGSDCGVTVRVLLEVNVSGEGSKFGFRGDELPGVMASCNDMAHVEVAGLMTIPPVSEKPADARPHFVRVRNLRDGLRAESGMELGELSMGMSHDFEIAIEEGATWVRLGTALFGKRGG